MTNWLFEYVIPSFFMSMLATMWVNPPVETGLYYWGISWLFTFILMYAVSGEVRNRNDLKMGDQEEDGK